MSYTVRVGEHYLERHDGTEKDFAVAEVHVHERYNVGRQFNNDIALLKLKNPVDFQGPYAGPACLPPTGKDYRGSQNCVLSGWGLVQRYPQRLADRLQKVTGRIWGAQELLRQYGRLPEHVSDSASPGAGPPAWVTLAAPSSAPTDMAPMTSSVSSPSVPAPAPENPASSPKFPNTERGF